MANFALLLEAIAKVLWPVLFFATIWIFKTELSRLIKRINKAKIGDNEIEFEVEKFEKEVEVFVEENAKKIEKAQRNKIEENRNYIPLLSPKTNDLWSSITEKIDREPEVAIILTSGQIEQILRNEFLRNGIKPPNRGLAYLGKLATSELGFSVSLSNAIEEFSNFRNRAVHGEPIKYHSAKRIAQLGLEILNTLYHNQTTPFLVYYAGLEVYKDKNCTHLIPEFEGMFLAIGAIPGATGSGMYAITDKKNYYKHQDSVSAEWMDTEIKYKKYSDLRNLWIKDETNHETVKFDLETHGIFIGKRYSDLV